MKMKYVILIAFIVVPKMLFEEVSYPNNVKLYYFLKL